jgi:parallel beta-helix repeat protein
MKIIYFLKIIILVVPLPLFSATFYLDPEEGNTANDGSSEHPWTTVQEVLDSNLIETYAPFEYPYLEGDSLILINEGAPVKTGDTLICRTGYYGALHISRKFNTSYITIRAEEGHTPTFKNIRFTGTRYWHLQGLIITPSSAPEYENTTLISIEWHNWSGPSTYITVENCDLYSTENTLFWSAEDWDELSCTAIASQGKNVIIRNNYCKNVNFGISSSGDSCLVEYNTIENFAGDGLRGLGNYNTFQYNIVKNSYDVNGNHDDGFQSWSVGEGGVGTDTVWGVILRGNTIINFEDPNQPHRGTLQGIGCFDGFYANWIVENNVVIVNHYHGITLSGAVNCRIINNTVADRDTTDSDISPWIRVGNHKDGSASEGCIVRNNIYHRTLSMDTTQTVDHNLRVRNYDSNFVDFDQFDLRLREGSPAIDAGTGELAPAIDIRGISRPQGSLYDIGAYEHALDEESNFFSPLIIYPNPFNTFTDITFTLLTYGDVCLEIYNSSGAKIKEYVDHSISPRTYRYTFYRETFPSGAYFAYLKVNNQIASKKVILIK